MLSPSMEDYLEEIYRLAIRPETVRVTDISVRLNVSLPSVTKALGKLRAGGYISYQKYGLIELTAKGRETGAYLVARNTLLQDFLTTLGAACDVAAEAEAMEHYLSKAAIDSIERWMRFLKEHEDVRRLFREYARR